MAAPWELFKARMKTASSGVYVLDVHGNRYTVARNAGACLLLGPDLGIIEVSRRFDDVFEALRNSL